VIPRASDYTIEPYTPERFVALAKIREDVFTPLREGYPLYNSKYTGALVSRELRYHEKNNSTYGDSYLMFEKLRHRVEAAGIKDAVCYLKRQ
jgi:hypothetical protein